MRFGGLLLAIALVTSPARADVWTDIASDQRAIVQLDAGRVQGDARRAALERQSQAQAAEIDRLKAQPAGVRRDLKLQELLAAQKATSDELERQASDLRARSSLLAGARKKLIADCDRALSAPLADARRLELTRLRTAQAAWLALPERPIGVARAETDPLDGPRELQDKADLLRDSRDKLRREAYRLAQRIDSVERRRHLRERAGAVDEDLFGEAISNRRTARAASTASGGQADHGSPSQNAGSPTAGGAAGGSAGGATPPTVGAPGPSTGSGTPSPAPGGSTSGSAGFGSGDTTTVLRNLVDPATLDELRRADNLDDLDGQLRALRRAQGELQNLADEIDRRARALSTRADELKHRK